MQEIEKPRQLEPIKPVRWALYAFLAAIPLVGLILLILWSFGDGERIEKRNWARGQLMFRLLLYLAWIFFVVLFFAFSGWSLYRLFNGEIFY